MKKSLVLCSAVAVAMGMRVAVAQQSTASQPIEEIVVTGVRASIESAQEIKQQAIEIVDAIVAEDIGKLPDNSAAEALQRVPGVQIARARGDASLVLIRGLPNFVTTLNDRQIFTTTGRGIALADIPADLVKQIEVFKTQSADQFAGGLVGAINVDLRRPFDFDGFAAGRHAARAVQREHRRHRPDRQRARQQPLEYRCGRVRRDAQRVVPGQALPGGEHLRRHL